MGLLPLFFWNVILRVLGDFGVLSTYNYNGGEKGVWPYASLLFGYLKPVM